MIELITWLPLTVMVFLVAEALYRHSGFIGLLHPVLTACLILIPLLLWLQVDYSRYRQGSQPLLWLLGPATIALAVPLADRLEQLRKIWKPVLISVAAGSVVAMGSALLIGWALGLDALTLRTLIGKSVTTPIAMGVAEQVGGAPELAAAIVIVVGVMGAGFAVSLLNALGVTNYAARGVAMGLSAHGVGTARALQLGGKAGAETGAYAGLAMGLTGLVTAGIAAVIALFL